MQQLNVGLAFVAGLLSFLSPCVLPLIPSYLSFVGGTSARQLESEGRARLSALVNTAFFVLGFSIVFVLLGAFFTVAIGALGRLTVVVNIVAGVIVVLLGLNFIFDFWRFLAFERRAHLAEKPTGVLGALLVGMAFGGGWAPCVGPILSSILLLAGTGGGTLQGIGLLFVYSIGLGVPFLVTGLFFSRARTLLDRLKPHLPTIKIASGLFLIGIGLLIAVGKLQQLNVALFSGAVAVESWGERQPVASRWVVGMVFAALAGLSGWWYARRLAAGKSRAVPLVLAVILATLGALSVAGVLEVTGLLSSWLSYQGI